jgi:hypothetical protein
MFNTIFKVATLSVFLSTAVFADIDNPEVGDTDSADFQLTAEHNGNAETLTLFGSVFTGVAHSINPTLTSSQGLGFMGVSSAAVTNFSGICSMTATTVSGASGTGIGSLREDGTGVSLVDYIIRVGGTAIDDTTARVINCNDTSTSGGNTVSFQTTSAPSIAAPAGTYSDTVTLTLTIS